MENLSRLQTLNLKGNKISNIADISAIKAMRNLEHLYLSGNPIELSEHFPSNVFDLQPNLKTVDHWERTSSHCPDETAPLPCAPMSSLEAELQATNEAFSLQERTLAANGQELARLCASLASPNSKASSPFGSLTETEVLENFPFYRMLQTWRKQALSSTMARTIAEHELQRAVREAQRDRQELLSRAQENEAKALLWRQRSAGWEEKCSSLEQAVRERDQLLAVAAQEAEQRDQQLFNLQQQHRNLAQYLKHMKAQADHWAVLQTAEVVRGAEKLRQMEARVAAAAERVAFTAEVVAQKEVHVRNSLAALDAERRLLQMSKQSGGAPANCASNVSASVGQVDSAASTDDEGGVRLEPEAEALLRAIFRTMDPDDSGLVSVQLLVKCLLVEMPQNDDANGAAEMDADTATATPLGELVCRAVGPHQWMRLVRALLAASRASAAADLTWGEFLLQFIPVSVRATSTPGTAKLSASELRDLRKVGLLGDLDWGLFPLQLPHSSTASSAVQPPTTASAGAGRSPEHRQLLAERKYLMQRLQDMTRTLERRAEGIKGYFEGSIRREQLKEERMATQISETQHSLAVSQARQAELEQLLAHSRAQYESRVPQLEAQVEDLRESMRATHRELVDKYELTLQAEAAKAAALEGKVEALKKDCSNRDIKRRAMESDLRRLSESQKTSMGEISSLKERLAEAQQALRQTAADCEAQARAKDEKGEAERALAKAELEALRAQLASCTERMMQVEAQRAAVLEQQMPGKQQEPAQTEQPAATPGLPLEPAGSAAAGSSGPAAAAVREEEEAMQQERVRQLQAEVHALHSAIAAARSPKAAVALPATASPDRSQQQAGLNMATSATQAHLDSVLRRLEQVLS